MRKLLSKVLQALSRLVLSGVEGYGEELLLEDDGKFSIENLSRVLYYLKSKKPEYLTPDTDASQDILDLLDVSEAPHIRKAAMQVYGYDKYMIVGMRSKPPSGVRYCDVVECLDISISRSPANEAAVYPYRLTINSTSLNYPIGVRLTNKKIRKLFRVLVTRGRVDFYGYLLGTLAGSTLLRIDYGDYSPNQTELKELHIFQKSINELHKYYEGR